MYTNLIETPLVAPQLPDTSLIIIVDLARPELIWSTLTTLLASVKVMLASDLSILLIHVSDWAILSLLFNTLHAFL